MGWMWVFWLLLIAGVVVLAVVVARALLGGTGERGASDTRHGTASSGRNRAREILDECFARGELTTEEYQERLRGLGGDR